MTITPNTECVICGKQYYFCNCTSIEMLNPWKGVTCSIEHAKFHFILRDYQDNRITKVEAGKLIVDQCNINDIENFDKDKQEYLNDIIKEYQDSIQPIQPKEKEKEKIITENNFTKDKKTFQKINKTNK